MPKVVQQIKDDALLDIKVNKSYYLMVKNLSLYLFSSISEEDRNSKVANIKEKKYEEMDDVEKSFYTVALLISEIEKQAKETNSLEDKEVLVPGDEGFEMPKIANED